MCWSYIVFRIVIESRRLAEHAGRPSSALNAVVGELIDQGFAAQQVLAVRRLMEPASKDAVRQVISLRRLVDDLKAHRRIITREVFVGFDGAPFDPKPGRE